MLSTYPASIRRQNDLLRSELGTQHGFPRYQWAWSEDLVMPMVILGTDGKPEIDFYCLCGRNISIHTNPACRWTEPRIRWEIRKLLPQCQDQWVMCRWVPPEASKEDWQAMFGSQPYPENGYFIPVGDPTKTLALKAGERPLLGTTEWIIAGVKDHLSKSSRQRDQETKDGWAEADRKKEEELIVRCKDAFPVHMGWPGEKQDWSAGGADTPSPVLRKFEESNGNRDASI